MPPSPATPRLPCTRCGEDRIPADAIQCPTCYWTLDEAWDEHEAYSWHIGVDLCCRGCGALWSSKVQYCLGDWCGGPVEPVDGSWHVAWRLLNSADPGQLHTTMPNFAGGRYEREDVEVVRIRGPCPMPRPSPSAAGSSSAHAGLAPDGVNHEDGLASSEHADAAPAHTPSAVHHE